MDEGLFKDIERIVGKFMKTHTYFLRLFDSFEDMKSELICSVLGQWRLYDEGRGKVSTFVYMICWSRCKRVERNSARSVKCDVSLDEPLSEDGESTLIDVVSNGVDVDSEVTSKMLVEWLTPHMCEAVKLYYLDGLTQKEIADKLGVTQSVVSKRISKGIVRLRKALDGDFSSVRSGETMKRVKEIMESRGCSERTAFRVIAKERK